jgi:predicted nucleic acid-binding Zn ribbon protein
MRDQGPEPLSEVLSRLFIARGWGRTQEQLRLEQAWAEVAGPDVAKQTQLGAMRRGVLEVEVGNGSLLQELVGFHKRRLLEGMKKKLAGVVLKDLRFRAGVMKKEIGETGKNRHAPGRDNRSDRDER